MFIAVSVTGIAAKGLGIDLVARLRQSPIVTSIAINTSKPLAIGIWRNDPILGFAHAPNMQGEHITDDFSVTYTIDDRGCRVMNRPDAESTERVVPAAAPQA